jgi:AraC-like DNA-binding protein
MAALACPMLYQTYTPHPPLADFVNVFWLYQGSVLPHAKERLLPTGTVELVINLREDTLRIYDPQDHDQFQRFPGSLVCGPHSEFFVIDTASQDLILGVHFKPGGAFPFFNLPADELHNMHVSLDTLWGGEAGYLRERLLAAATPEAKFSTLEQVLLAQAARPLARHPAVALLLKELQNGSYARPIGNIIEQIGLSRRRFIQLFRAEVGLTPKLFGRVQRFQEVLHRIGSGQPLDWTDTALSCGYFDQAHFIHDFQAFSGLNPTAYLVQRSEHLNHVPLYD